MEQPLFEDLSEDGSMVLFDDEDFSEDKTDALVYYLTIGGALESVVRPSTFDLTRLFNPIIILNSVSLDKN